MGDATPTSPHPEEPHSGVSKDEGLAEAQTGFPMVRDAAAPLLTMRGRVTSIIPSSRGTPCRGDPSFSGALHQAWIAASGFALLAMTGVLLIKFNTSSRGAGTRQLALFSMGDATPTSPHPEEPHSGVSKDEGLAEAQTGFPMVRDAAAPLLTMRGRPTSIVPSSRGTQCRGDPTFIAAQHQAWIAASGYALLAMIRESHGQRDLSVSGPVQRHRENGWRNLARPVKHPA